MKNPTDKPLQAQETQNVVSSESRLLHITARGLAVVVAGGAAVLSFNALSQLAVAAGIDPHLAWLWAVVVDGFILIATISVFALRKRGRRALAWPFFILGLFVAISIIGNALHPMLRTDLQLGGTPDFGNGGHLPFWAAAVVTAVPPVALFLAIHLLIIMVTPSKEQEKKMVAVAKAAEKEQKKQAAVINPAPAASLGVSAPTFPAPVSTRIETPVVKPVTQIPRVPELKTQPVLAEQKTVISVPALPSKEENVETIGSDEPVDFTGMSPEQQLVERLLAGEKVTGQAAADLLGVSLRTGQVKLKKLREELGLN